MDQNTFEVMIYNIEKFAREIFSSGMEAKFKVRLMETLDQIMKLGKSQDINWPPSTERKELRASENIKLEQERNMDLPNEIWSKIIKFLPSNDVYQSLNLVSKRFQSLALHSGVLRVINFQKRKISDEKMNFLKTSTVPMKFIFGKSSLIVIPGEMAISMTQNLKSLKFCSIYGGTEYLPRSSIDIIVQSNCKLQHLEIDAFYVPPNVMIQISRIKTLRTFRIFNKKMVVITPEVVNAFAENENKLENIEFNDIKHNYDSQYGTLRGYEDKLNIAVNNLLEKKSSTLRSLKYANCARFNHASIPLTNLKLCQNLEEFCGQLRKHDIETLAKLPRLKKLRLLELENPKYLLDNLNLGHLKYLFITDFDEWCEDRESIHQEFQKHIFPNLQRLFIDAYGTELTEDFFSNLIANAPKLKSIHLSNSKMSVSHQFMYNFCKNSNIFVSFKSQSFEDFLLDMDINVYGKYKRLEKTYKEWSSNNPEYSSL